jgi:hypothetical protein
MFGDAHIDHLVPLAAVADDASQAKIKAYYNLSTQFDFDYFENWVPAHQNCNQRKSFTLASPSPAFTTHIAEIEAKKHLAIATTQAIQRDQSKAQLLAKISAAAQKGDITEDEIRRAFSGLPVIAQKSENLGFLVQDKLLIAPGWEVLSVLGKLHTVVSRGGRTGVTSTSDDPSWTCSRCGNKGPWSGVVCLTCGNREEPD